VAIVISGLLLGAAAPASGGTAVGPMQINPVTESQLCWQATGNVAPIVLAACDPFSASVTIANAASAQTAYGAAMAFGLPRSLAATALHAVGGASGFRCDSGALTCTGTLRPGIPGRIGISRPLPRDAAPGASYTVSARVAVRDTSQLSGTVPTTALVNGSAGAPTPAPATGGGARPLSVPILVLIVGILLLAGSLLLGIAARTRPARPHAYARLRAYARFHAYAYARLHASARPHAYEGRRRRSNREPLAEPEHFARPGRHHARR
jgi:hypothetical protein